VLKPPIIVSCYGVEVSRNRVLLEG